MGGDVLLKLLVFREVVDEQLLIARVTRRWRW
jgi:hypothetical protein